MLSGTCGALVFLSATLVCVAGGAFCLWRRFESASRPPLRTLTAGDCASVGLSMFGLWLTMMAALVAMGLDEFGLIHVAYLGIVVAIPAIGASLLLMRRLYGKRGVSVSRTVITAAIATLALPMVGIYASCIEPYRLEVERADLVVDSNSGARPLRIGVLADLQTDHVSDYERNAVSRLMSLSPDVILLPGDVFQGGDAAFETELPALRALFAQLRAPGGVFLVQGNVDGSRERLERLVTETPVRLLFNEAVRLEIGDRWVTIAGLDLELTSVDARATLARVTSDASSDDIRLLVSHRPDAVLQLGANSNIDLVVAGHTHGGQVVVPFFGPPITLSRVPRHVAAGGLHRVDGNMIYVSRGVGCERDQAPRLRFLCPPEVSLITIGAAIQRQ